MQALLAETRGQLEEKKQALREDRDTLTELKEFEQKLLKQLHDITLVRLSSEHVYCVSLVLKTRLDSSNRCKLI